MRSRGVIVGHIRANDPFEVTRVHHDDMVETLATDGADEPLDIGRLPGRARCDAHFINTEAAHTAPESFAVDGIAVAQKVARRGVEGKRLDYLLCPCRQKTPTY